ncbi:MAG: metallophosphoesterase [Bryobacteraceae bacterium]|nr:metallophosphoesterase [Bryobacteraceae bacterium]
MKTIVHVSDLHFSKIDERLVSPAIEAIRSVNPDILAVSGDLTQHAYASEFAAAMQFIQQLPGVRIIVPGNHDMSFYNLLRRATQRLKLFREMVTNDPEPFYCDSEIAVLGLNTARVTHLRDGRIRSWQMDRLEARMEAVDPGAVRVLVTHHPFDLPDSFADRELIGRKHDYRDRVVKCIDVLLAGHMHISFAGPTALRLRAKGDSAIFVQAGTALSTRTRSECNSFQVLRISADTVETQQWLAEDYKYQPRDKHEFRKSERGWTPLNPETETVAV